MSEPVERLGPEWSRVVIAFVGAFAAAAVPVLIPLALGLSVPSAYVGPFIAVVLVYCVFFMVGIFWSGQWAARVVPPSDISPVDYQEMRRRLLALNALPLPYEAIEDRPGQFRVQWRPDIIRTQHTETGGITRSSRMIVRLVERGHQARASEVETRVSWSNDTKNYRWHGGFSGFRGISLASYAAGGTYGLTFRHGEWALTPGYRWSHSLNELKQPLMQAVVLSGWTWQPVVFR